MLKIKLLKSLAGRHKTHIATAHSLGLKRVGDTTEQPDTPQTQGKLRQIAYLIEVTASDAKKKAPKKKA